MYHPVCFCQFSPFQIIPPVRAADRTKLSQAKPSQLTPTRDRKHRSEIKQAGDTEKSYTRSPAWVGDKNTTAVLDNLHHTTFIAPIWSTAATKYQQASGGTATELQATPYDFVSPYYAAHTTVRPREPRVATTPCEHLTSDWRHMILCPDTMPR